MSNKLHHRKKKNIVAFLVAYGFHLWVLLIVANVLIFYSFSLFSFGAEPNEQTIAQLPPSASQSPDAPKISPPEAPVVEQPAAVAIPTSKTPPAKAKGPLLSLTFSVPGIGSGGGTMTPKRPTRNLIIHLYKKDVNSTDNNVKPLHSIRTTAVFDDVDDHINYTAFYNNFIDLGDTVDDGEYQVAFTTDQSLRKLVTDKEGAVSGTRFKITRHQKTIIPRQSVIMGDMVPPEGNNVMDIEDYNALVECFGKTTCKSYKQADLNDDGIIDGIDYNIMARGFSTLVALGQTPPRLPTVTPKTITKLIEQDKAPQTTTAPEPSPAATTVKQESSGAGPAIIGFIIFLLLACVGVFVGLRTKAGKDLLAKFKKGKEPAVEGADAAPQDGQAPTAEAAPADAPPADTAAIAESTEIPVESLPAEAAPPTEPAPGANPEAIAESTEIPIAEFTAAKEAPAAQPAPAAGTVDKTYYVKKKSTDDKGTWVVLTDDGGPIDGLLPTGNIEDGFERIKGTMTEENGKKYLLINEILPAE